jgi:hypothetical protein
MSVQPVEVCVHVEMQIQLINGLNTRNTGSTIFGFSGSEIPKVRCKVFKQVKYDVKPYIPKKPSCMAGSSTHCL